MPIYEYKCLKCKKRFERIVKYSKFAKDIDYCECGNIAIKLFPLKNSFRLKGDCWSKDGYVKKEETWQKHMRY